MTRKIYPWAIILFAVLAPVLFCQTPVPSGDHLSIKLVTIDPGKDLTTWWGHTGIIVEDTVTKSGRFYNYGLFSFDQENFTLNFARGRLVFWVGVWDAGMALQFYQGMDRTIRIQTLDLSPEQKLATANFLAWNVRPENREYLYDHYFDNCATRVRDLFDKILADAFLRDNDQPGRMSLRDHTRRHTHRSYFMDWLLMFLMNDSIDKPIRQWDEMFLPTELERAILKMSVTDAAGNVRPLVMENEIYYQAEDAYQVPDFPPRHWPAGLAVGIILAALVFVFDIRYKNSSRRGKYLLGSLYLLLGLVFGIPGSVLFLMSLFTNHIVTFYNENLFLANPLTFLLVIAGYGIMRQNKFIVRYIPLLSTLLAFGVALLFILKILPSFDQQNWLSICLISPVVFTIAWTWRGLMFKKNQVK